MNPVRKLTDMKSYNSKIEALVKSFSRGGVIKIF